MVPQEQFETDTIETSGGPLDITFLGHGTLMLKFNDKVIHIDPFTRVADYSNLPKADLILITHEHHDHLDLDALSKIQTEKTVVILTETCAQQLDGGIVMQNGDVHTFDLVTVEAVPAYNLLHKRENGQPFHPKGVGNGYILTFGDTRVYVAGDTENIPEMKAVADAANAFRPDILYPYHFGNTDTSELVDLLKEEDIQVRIRKLA
jgi:L-ascorbate metabolism protein UlaG (beta-lactamase superfamily)